MNDIEKLRLLLPHWLEHNAEHANEFRTWAERARSAGEEHLAGHLEAAVEKMEAANRDLAGAIEHLGPGAAGHVHDHAQLDHDHSHPH